MRPQEQAAARALAEWREQRAIDSDKPRGWILADDALFAIATRAPETLEQLAGIPAMPPGTARKHGEELLRLAHAARSGDDLPEQSIPRKPTPEETGRARNSWRRCAKWLATSASERKYSPRGATSRRSRMGRSRRRRARCCVVGGAAQSASSSRRCCSGAALSLPRRAGSRRRRAPPAGRRSRPAAVHVSRSARSADWSVRCRP